MSMTKQRCEELLREGIKLGRPLADFVATDIEADYPNHPYQADVDAWERWRNQARVALGELGVGALLTTTDNSPAARRARGLEPIRRARHKRSGG